MDSRGDFRGTAARDRDLQRDRGEPSRPRDRGEAIRGFQLRVGGGCRVVRASPARAIRLAFSALPSVARGESRPRRRTCGSIDGFEAEAKVARAPSSRAHRIAVEPALVLYPRAHACVLSGVVRGDVEVEICNLQHALTLAGPRARPSAARAVNSQPCQRRELQLTVHAVLIIRTLTPSRGYTEAEGVLATA